ncbi:MAG: META domain-containing protein [Paracoccaceae bacterium]
MTTRHLLASLLAGMAFLGQAQGAMARPAEGTLGYPQRIALPEDALVVIEWRGPDGAVAGESRFATEGRQVPLPFTLDLPDGMDLSLRAAVFVAGRTAWLSDMAGIVAGETPVAIGELRLTPFQPMGFDSVMQCGDLRLRIGFVGEDAVMELPGGERRVLSPAITASGAKYAAADDPDTWFWSKGGTLALVSLAGRELPECFPVPPAPGPGFQAAGNEPFWMLRLDEGRISFTPNIGEDPVTAPLPAPRLDGSDFVFDAPEAALRLRLAPRICHDSMSGMPHPQTVTVTHDGQDYSGCGGAPLDLLLGGEWVVEDIAGGGMIDAAHVTMAFTPARISGQGGCNRYSGGFTLTGEGLSFGPAIATRMACAPALMDQESRFFGLLPQVAGFDIDETGALLLLGADGVAMITARRGG